MLLCIVYAMFFVDTAILVFVALTQHCIQNNDM